MMTSTVIKLPEEKRAALSRALREGRTAKGWSLEEAADRATLALRDAATAQPAPSKEEVAVWSSIEVTRHHVAKLENCPTNPIATLQRRSCLLGLVLALGLDRARINSLAGAL